MNERLETLQEVDLLLAQMHDEASESVEKAYGDFLLALEEYRKRQAAVIFAPSLDRGYDFRDDDSGQRWYTIQTIRSLVQMTGRGVRSSTDHATTYILDAGFIQNMWKKSGTRRLFPQWWRDAVRTDLSPRRL